MQRALLLVSIAIVSVAAAPEKPATSGSTNPHRAVLAQFGVTDDAPGIAKFLKSIHPLPEEQAKIVALVEQLGDPDYRLRQSASREIAALPVVPMQELKLAVASGDPEVRWRASQILSHAGHRTDALLHAALKSIHYHQHRGLAEPVLMAMPLCNEPYMRRALRTALIATTTDQAQDVELLQQSLKSEDPQVRIAASAALAPLLGGAADAALAALLTDEHPEVRLAAATAIAKQQSIDPMPSGVSRQWMTTLGELLASSDSSIRRDAFSVLRQVTGQKLQLDPLADPTAQAEQVAAWQAWIAGPGLSSTLHKVRDRSLDLGRLLICLYAENRVLELQLDDSARGSIADLKPTWEQVIAAPWACQGLPNGNRLIASYQGRFVVEYDSTGKEVWRKDGLTHAPYSVQRLEDGNTLLALSDAQRVIEINPAGEEVWTYIAPVGGRPLDAQRLPSGNTLITLQTQSRVVEVDPEQNIVWQLEGLPGPLSALRLENGNTLVCLSNINQVREISPSKIVVWEKSGLRQPYDAKRLESGNTIISDSLGIREFDTDGEVVWERLGSSVSRSSRY